MEITNLNLLSIIIFLTILAFGVYFCMRKYDLYTNSSKIFKKIKKSKFSYIKYIFLAISLIVLSFSIFGIKKGTSTPSTNIQEGIEIIFALDVSKSMNVADILSNNYSHSRLDFSKKSINDFVLKNPQNKYSLIVFAGDAVSTIPLTNDIELFLNILENVDYRNLITQGSDFEKAFELANNRLEISEDNSKAIIFISDGGDPEDIINEDSFKKFKNDSIKYFVVGVGTDDGGKIITGRDAFGRLIYQTYNNEYVISKLNEKNLTKISNTLDGNYLKLEKYNDMNIFSKELDKLKKKVIEENSYENKIDIGRTLSMISFFFFMIYLFFLIFEDRIYFLLLKDE